MTEKELKSTDSDQMKRVNITMPEGLHKDITDFTDERGTSFSSFVRRSIVLLRSRLENDGTPREFQPLLKEIKDVEENVAELDSSMSQIQKSLADREGANKQNAVPADGAKSSDEWMANRIYAILKEEGSKSIPELTESSGFDRQNIQRGINLLRDSYAIKECTDNTDVSQWEVR